MSRQKFLAFFLAFTITSSLTSRQIKAQQAPTLFQACEREDQFPNLRAKWTQGNSPLSSQLQYTLGHQYNDHLNYVTHLRFLVKSSVSREEPTSKVIVDKSIQICGPTSSKFKICADQILFNGRIEGTLTLDIPYEPENILSGNDVTIEIEEEQPFTVLYKLCPIRDDASILSTTTTTVETGIEL